MDKSRHRGFTLIELMVTVALVGVLLTAVIPNMRTFLRNNQLSGGVNDMLHSIQVARTEAIKRQNGNVVVCGTAAPTVADNAMACDYASFKGWFVFQDTNGNWQHDAAEPVLERHGLLDTNVTVRTDANARIISFAPSGFANPAGLKVPMRTLVVCDSRGVQQVGNTATARALFITTTGRARASSTWQDVKITALPLVGGELPVKIPSGQALRRANGFTMVEAMVALVVLAVGMLGIAGLYVTTLRSGGGAIYRMQAVNLASDLADRIRANRTANLAYLGPGANNNCYGAGAVDCAPALMAANDLLVWQNQVTAILPSGNGTLNVVAGAAATDPFTYTITITWLGSGDNAATPPSYVMTLQI